MKTKYRSISTPHTAALGPLASLAILMAIGGCRGNAINLHRPAKQTSTTKPEGGPMVERVVGPMVGAIIVPVIPAPAPVDLWTGILQRGLANNESYASSTSTDGQGNMFIAGYSSDMAFLVKFNPRGKFEWERPVASSALSINQSVSTDKQGNVIVAGWTQGGVNASAQIGRRDSFLIKYDTNGDILWQVQKGIAGSNSLTVEALATDIDGNSFILGGLSEAPTLDGLSEIGQSDRFLSKYSAGGILRWTKRMGVAQTDFGVYVAYENLSMTINSSGDVITAATLNYPENWPTVSQRGFVSLVTKYNNGDGAQQWVRQLGITSILAARTTVRSIAADGVGHIFVGGQTRARLDGNPKPVNRDDAIVAKFNSDGDLQWVKQEGVTGKNSGVSALAIDSSNNIIVGGNATDADTYLAYGTLAKYDTDGLNIWQRQITATPDLNSYSGSLYITAAAVDLFDSVIVGGWTGGATDGNRQKGDVDYFLAKFNKDGTML